MSSKLHLSSRKGESPSKPRRQPKEHDFLIVAVGASAGGLKAFTQLLNHLPRDPGLALVLIQHLAPKHESALTELLSRATDMPVTEVSEGTPVVENHVYVIPPNRDMEFHRGKLHLIPRGKAQPHMPIDYFFRSLAQDRGSRAIGAIFSGTASDGTLGLKAIKAAGGITFAQDPEKAEHSDMPRNAIAAGCVDFVLPIKGIVDELLRISRHPYLYAPAAAELEETAGRDDPQLRKIYAILRTATGVDFTHYKATTVRRRIRRRMLLLRLESLRAYSQFLQDHSNEVEALFQDVLIHVTGFFRDTEVFEALKTKVFPALMKDRPPNSQLRLWIPGCSTGEEVYSMAIVLLEFLSDSPAANRIQIFATDVNEAALEKARQGEYLENIAAEVSAERLRRYFVRTPHGFQINKSVRDLCVFARHDVSKDPPFSHLDLISCRNLLIYLGQVLQKRILPIFHYALKPAGYLLLGGSETIGSFADYFSLVDKKHKVYAKKAVHHPPLVTFGAHPYLHGGQGEANVNNHAGASLSRQKEFSVQKAAERLLLERYTPPGVIINEDFQILQFRGRVGRYLEPASGQASLNLGKMAREELVLDLRAAVHEAGKHNRPAKKEGLQVQRNGKAAEVSLEAIPLIDPESKGRCFLVLFRDKPAAGATELAGKSKALSGQRTASQAAAGQIRQLKDELVRNKGTLNSTIEELEATNEELRSANEEILSSNEELQSTNEELETAKEELQSANEELSTLNEELQNRNQELSLLNNDLLNLLGSVNIPILMLGNDLRVRRFTPSAQKLINLVHGDIGRSIGDIKIRFEFPGFEQKVAEAVDNIAVIEQEVQDGGGSWYSMRIRPYKTSENKIDGAVITWVEVTSMKAALDDTARRYDFIFQRNLAGVFYLQDGRVTDCNDAFAQILGYTSREEALQSVDWNAHMQPEEQRRLTGVLRQKKRLGNVEVFLTRRDGAPRWVLASVEVMPRPAASGQSGEVIEGVIVDITRQMDAERNLSKLAGELMKDSDDRRRMLARELHDVMGSRLAGLSASLVTLQRGQALDDKARKQLAECQKIVRDCSNEVRTISSLQHPLVIEEMGLGHAVRWYAREFSKRTGMKVQFDIPDALPRQSIEKEIALYRIVQESLTNIQRHSGSRVARIQIGHRDTEFLVEVEDFGKGFEPSREGMGIIGMRERMKQYGGRLEIESGKKGTTVRARVPLTALPV